MRSEGGSEVSEETDCEDPLVVLACNSDSDACPAACKEDSKEDTVVRSGDLSVTAEAATGRKAIVPSAVSDLDTLTFKTSEEVEITKITLERYGYSERTDVETVSLEDDDGNVIAEGKALNSKDQVVLSIKKDYRKVDGTYNATIVLNTAAGANAGGTIGFKVVDVESTAKNLNVDNYSPYTYDMVTYAGATATIDAKGTAKDYNYEAGESYEVARFKVSAAASALSVKGFTLTNKAANDVDVERYLDKVVVKAGADEVTGLKYNVNKSKELVISFDEVEIASKKNVTFIVSISFTDDFDDYQRSIQYEIANQSNFNAVEKKTGARLTVVLPTTAWVSHTFNGSKIRLTNVKTNNVEAAAGSEDVVVAQGSITVSETVKLPDFYIGVSNNGVDNIALTIAGEEYDGNIVKAGFFGTDLTDTTAAAAYKVGDFVLHNTSTSLTESHIYRAKVAVAKGATWAWASWEDLGETAYKFTGIEIEKSGKVEVKVDLDKDATGTVTFKPTSLNKDLFNGARYVDARQDVDYAKDVAGSISFASKLTVQAAKAALENNLTKTVEFVLDETNRKVVFDGTYTARKGDVNLNKFKIVGTDPADANDIEYYVFIDGEEIGNTSSYNSEETFSDVKVKNGESVKVKVEVSLTADVTSDGYSMSLYLEGEDDDGNQAGIATEAMKTFKVVSKGGVEISTNVAKKTIALREANSNIATFLVKPSNAGDEIQLENLKLSVGKITNDGTTDAITLQNNTSFRVKVDNVEQFDPEGTTAGYTYNVNENIPSEGLKVVVDLKNETDGKFFVDLLTVNSKTYAASTIDTKKFKEGGKTFTKQFVPAVVYITKQEDLDGTTKFTLAIDGKAESSYTLKDFCVYAAEDESQAAETAIQNKCKLGEFEDGDSFEAISVGGGVKMIKKITYRVEGTSTTDPTYTDVTVLYSDMPDYFKVGGNDARVYKVKS